MPEMLTVQLAQPIAGVRVVGQDTRPSDAALCAEREPATDTQAGAPAVESEEDRSAAERLEAAIQAERARMAEELQQQNDQFAQLCRAAGSIAANLDKLYQETLTGNRSEIARLAVEIARKVLMCKVAQGDYDIQAIIEEALKRAPTRQKIVIHLNPQDLPRCQQHQQERPDSPFAELEFTADWSVGPGECLVETPKGIVKSFIEEHLERISEALRKVEE